MLIASDELINQEVNVKRLINQIGSLKTDVQFYNDLQSTKLWGKRDYFVLAQLIRQGEEYILEIEYTILDHKTVAYQMVENGTRGEWKIAQITELIEISRNEALAAEQEARIRSQSFV